MDTETIDAMVGDANEAIRRDGYDYGGTHWDDCHKVHPRCSAFRLGKHVSALAAECKQARNEAHAAIQAALEQCGTMRTDLKEARVERDVLAHQLKAATFPTCECETLRAQVAELTTERERFAAALRNIAYPGRSLWDASFKLVAQNALDCKAWPPIDGLDVQP